MSTPVRATLIHAGMRDDMADRWTPLIQAAIARDGDSEFAAPSPALTRAPIAPGHDDDNCPWKAQVDEADNLSAELAARLQHAAPSPALTREALDKLLHWTTRVTQMSPSLEERREAAADHDAILEAVGTPAEERT